ncbi:heparinase II/III domain-containing protein [Kribbella sp. CA-247076]|uniref:heparinase II/III domain-containing protein n=1 Tax=Kribbella sp. CA-247076 TaxID=3239941 RepID=UPI003D943496
MLSRRPRVRTTIGLTAVCLLVCAVAFAGAVTVLMPGGRERSVAATVPGASVTPSVPSASAPQSPTPTRAPSTPVAQTGTYQCTGFSGIDAKIPLPMLFKDTFAWGDDPPYQVGDGSGDIRWRSDPYAKPSWYMWLHSLRWLGQGITAAGKGNRQALTHVTAVIQDWVRDNPYSWKGDVGAWESTMHRTNVLICARQAVLSGLRVRRLPAQYAWLDQALLDHARFLQETWGGPSNHGTDESIALFGVGCTLNRPELKTLAVERLTEAITTAIDPQGSTNEQSIGYAMFNYQLWGRATTALQRCGANPSPTINERRRALAEWLALATTPTGQLPQVGDAIRQKPDVVRGTSLEYAASLGKHGTRPPRRTAVFDAGYVFGRTGWGETRPFTQESAYTIRFGPGRRYHGHEDRTSITYVSHGRDILIDPGHSGYQHDKWQAWTKSQSAHNVMTVPNGTPTGSETRLTGAAIAPTSEYYALADTPVEGVERTRDVLVLKDPDLIITLDRGKSGSEQRYETLWHLAADQKVTVQSPTTVVAAKPGDTVRTHLLQIPYQQELPADAVSVEQGRSDPVQGWYYPTIFDRLQAPVVKFNRTGANATVLSAIVPSNRGETVAFSTRTAGGMFFVDLTVGARKTTVRITENGRLSRIS